MVVAIFRIYLSPCKEKLCMKTYENIQILKSKCFYYCFFFFIK